MGIPNFTADASLYKSGRVYRAVSTSYSASTTINLADYVDRSCYTQCRETCDCSGLISGARAACGRECNNECNESCTRPGEEPPRPSAPPTRCGNIDCLPGQVCTIDGCCYPSKTCNNRCLPPLWSCCGSGFCEPGSLCCGGGCCPIGTYCCGDKVCCRPGTSCLDLGFAGTYCL
jgi:hypothetical protein